MGSRANFATYKSIIVGLLVGTSVNVAAVMGAQTEQMPVGPAYSGLVDEAYLMTGEKMGAKSHAEIKQQLDEFMNMSLQEKQQIVTQLKADSNTNVDAVEQSQWGFLKNIINIDKFFDSGADASGSSSKSAADKADSAASVAQKIQNHLEQHKKEKQSLAKQEARSHDQIPKEAAKKAENPKQQPKPVAVEVKQNKKVVEGKPPPSKQDIELQREAAQQRRTVLRKKRAAIKAHRQELAQKKEQAAKEFKEKAEELRAKRHEAEAASSAAKRRILLAEADNMEQALKEMRAEESEKIKKNKQTLVKQQSLAVVSNKARAAAREKEMALKREARRQQVTNEGLKAAQERKERHKALKARRFVRQNKINFLSSLVTPPAPEGKNKFYVTKDQAQWFTKPERFYIVQYQNTKKGSQVWLYKAFNVLSLRRAFLKFRGFIRQDYIKDNLNDRQYGLIANNKLLFSTSTFKQFVEDKQDQFLASAEPFQVNSEEFANDNTAKYFLGFGLQRGIIKMPEGTYDPEGKEFQVFTLNKQSKNTTSVKVGENKAEATKAYKNAAKDASQIVVLIDKEGKALKFSSKNKPEMYELLADYLQTTGNSKNTIFDEQQTGFELLPEGEKPAPEPTRKTGHKHHKGATSSASTAGDSNISSEQGKGKVLPKHIRRTINENRKLRKKIHAKERDFNGPKGKEQEKEKKYSAYGKRILNLLNNGYKGNGKKLDQVYNFGVIARDQKTKQYRRVAEVQSNNMKLAYDRLKEKIIEDVVDKRTGEMVMMYAETTPLFCSVPSTAFQCRQMVGYALTEGLIKPEKGLFHGKRRGADDFFILQRHKGSGQVRLTSVGSNLDKAKHFFKKASQNKKMIVGLMDSDAKLIQKTVTNPTKKGDARYSMLYGSIGLYQTQNAKKFTHPLKSEKEAGLR